MTAPRRSSPRSRRPSRRTRKGAATLDYILVLGVIFPLAAFIMWVAPRIIRLVYEMSCVLINSPFF